MQMAETGSHVDGSRSRRPSIDITTSPADAAPNVRRRVVKSTTAPA